MALPLPGSLSPSKVSSFKSCPLAFRFSAIDKLPEPPSPHLTKGTLVHSALERLFWDVQPGDRSIDTALECFEEAWAAIQDDPDLTDLELSDRELADFRADSEVLVRQAIELEDPNSVNAIGVELMLQAQVGGTLLRGIIDRLDLTDDGELIVVDYKTGRVPGSTHEQSRLEGVQFYALLCEQVLGKRPVAVRLYYLRGPVVIEAIPSEQTVRGSTIRTTAIWNAIIRACETEDFRPKPSALCKWCSFQRYCPAVGGDLSLVDRMKAADVR
jgi:putative RecB family exonuclease